MLGRLMLVCVCGVIQGCASVQTLGDNTHKQQMPIALYEGNGASQDFLCEFDDEVEGSWNFTSKSRRLARCPNNEARSLFLINARPGTEIRVYDRSDGDINKDDWAIITVLRAHPEGYAVRSFEKSYEDHYVEVKYHRPKNKSGDRNFKPSLDGKVSSIWIKPGGGA